MSLQYFVVRPFNQNGHDQLWSTDGSAAGTHEVREFTGYVQGCAIPSATLFFDNDDFTNPAHADLYDTNGAAAGTVMLATPVQLSGQTPQETVFGSKLFFSDNGDLWSSDGTAVGTSLTKAIGSNEQFGGSIVGMCSTGAKFYFGFNNYVGGSGGHHFLYSSDGTAAGTQIIASYTNTNGISQVGVLNDKVFVALSESAQWISSDGTALDFDPSQAVKVGSMWFGRLSHETYTTLWEWDGTSSTDHLIPTFTGAGFTGPGWIFDFQGTAMFSGTADGVHQELWRSDGTGAGTYSLAQVLPTTDLVELNGRMVFGAKSASGTHGLWTSDGTTAGTRELVQFAGQVNSSSVNLYQPNVPEQKPAQTSYLDGEFYFIAENGLGAALYKTDGTSSGTIQVVQLDTNPASGNPYLINNVGGSLYIVQEPGATASALSLWHSDGTAQGTSQIGQFNNQEIWGFFQDPHTADAAQSSWVQSAAATIFRTTWSQGQAASVVEMPGYSQQQTLGTFAAQTQDITSAILSIFEFMGATADSASLTAETNLIASFNQQFSAAAGWSAIGASLADSRFAPNFAANYQNQSVDDFITNVTQQAFGTVINSTALHNELAIYQDFFQHYTDPTDPTGMIRARGAFVADMLHQASDYATIHPGSSVGQYEQASEAFLVGLVEGTKQYGQSIFS